MIKSLLCSFVIFISIQGRASQVDSLIHLANESANDSLRTFYWHAAAQRIHTDSALLILHARLAWANEVQHEFWQAKLHQTLGKKCQQIRGGLDSLILYSKKSYGLFDLLNNEVEKGRSGMQIGIGLANKGERQEAMRFLLEAAVLFEQGGAHSILAPLYINMASIYAQAGELDKEIELLRKANKITKSTGDERNEAISSMGIRTYYVNQGNLDSAEHYAQRAFEIAQKRGDPILKLYSLFNLASMEEGRGNIEKAESYYLSLLALNPVGHDGARMRYRCGDFYYKTNRLRKARAYLEVALAESKELGASDLTMNIQAILTNVYKKLGMFRSATLSAHDYMHLADSLHGVEVRSNVNELSIKYESEKKERENQELLAKQGKKELEIIKLNTKLRQQVFLVILGVLAILAAILISFFLKKQQRQKLQIARQKQAIQEQKISELEAMQMITSMKSLVQGQENERGRIAKELHDGIGSIMASLKLSLSQLPHYGERQDYQQLVSNINALYDKANSELRRIAQNLMPATLTRYGLIAALEDFVAELNYSGKVHIDFQYLFAESNLPDELSLSLYRVIQELLNNAIRHGKPSEVLVQLMKHDDVVNITVEDNGLGFDVNNMDPGNGLQNIESRLAFFGGHMRIESNPKLGTTIYIECPAETKSMNQTIK